MHPLTKLALAAVSLASAVACAPTADADAPGASSDAVTSTEAKAGAKTYKASCTSRFNSAELTITIAGGKVTKLAGKVSTQDGKLRDDRTTSAWDATIASDVTSVDALPAASAATLRVAGKPLDLTASQVRPSADGTEVETASSCKTTATIATIDIRSKVTPDGFSRGISLSKVKASDATCFSMSALATAVDSSEEDWWDITCDEDDVHSRAEGLQELVDALTAAAKP